MAIPLLNLPCNGPVTCTGDIKSTRKTTSMENQTDHIKNTSPSLERPVHVVAVGELITQNSERKNNKKIIL